MKAPLLDAGIFYPLESSSFFSFHFNNLKNFDIDSVTQYRDATGFVQSKHKVKIACLQIPYPFWHGFKNLVDCIYDHCDHLMILGSELHESTVSFIREYDREKITYFLCGFLDPALKSSSTYLYLDWFTTTIYFYKNVRPQTLDILRPYESKPYYLDALLGRPKPHRQSARNFIHQRIKDKAIVTYMKRDGTQLSHRTEDEWLWEKEGLEVEEEQVWTGNTVSYYGHRMGLSQILPLIVYNQTAYSIVAETNFDDNYVFFTEKTIKPIIAKRLFVMVGQRHALKRLRELGFKTFSSIIDESYDDAESSKERFSLAFAEIEKLCAKPQEEILELVKPITEHNFKHAMDTDWYDFYFRTHFEKCISNCLKSLI